MLLMRVPVVPIETYTVAAEGPLEACVPTVRESASCESLVCAHALTHRTGPFALIHGSSRRRRRARTAPVRTPPRSTPESTLDDTLTTPQVSESRAA